MTKSITDHFSPVAADYAQFRPRYPLELFNWLASITPAHNLAWDCAAGSGQASVDLAAHFTQVIATDISAAQLDAAPAHSSITYRVAPAENSGLSAHSVDLLCVAQALHWFDLDGFYAEVNRVLKPGGVLAAWTYNLFTIEGHDVASCVSHFYEHTVGPYWPPQRSIVASGYRTLLFPFQEIAPPDFEMTTHWTLPQLLGYLRSWSASNRYLQDTGVDPVVSLSGELSPLWGDADQPRRIDWPLALRVGCINQA